MSGRQRTDGSPMCGLKLTDDWLMSERVTIGTGLALSV